MYVSHIYTLDIKKRQAPHDLLASPTVGLEPATTWLRALRSTGWARRALQVDWKVNGQDGSKRIPMYPTINNSFHLTLKIFIAWKSCRPGKCKSQKPSIKSICIRHKPILPIPLFFLFQDSPLMAAEARLHTDFGLPHFPAWSRISKFQSKNFLIHYPRTPKNIGKQLQLPVPLDFENLAIRSGSSKFSRNKNVYPPPAGL